MAGGKFQKKQHWATKHGRGGMLKFSEDLHKRGIPLQQKTQQEAEAAELKNLENYLGFEADSDAAKEMSQAASNAATRAFMDVLKHLRADEPKKPEEVAAKLFSKWRTKASSHSDAHSGDSTASTKTPDVEGLEELCLPSVASSSSSSSPPRFRDVISPPRFAGDAVLDEEPALEAEPATSTWAEPRSWHSRLDPKQVQKRLHRPVSQMELVVANMPTPLTPLSFPPLLQRLDLGPEETHYDFFARQSPERSPLQEARRRQVEAQRRIVERTRCPTSLAVESRVDCHSSEGDSHCRGEGSARSESKPNYFRVGDRVAESGGQRRPRFSSGELASPRSKTSTPAQSARGNSPLMSQTPRAGSHGSPHRGWRTRLEVATEDGCAQRDVPRDGSVSASASPSRESSPRPTTSPRSPRSNRKHRTVPAPKLAFGDGGDENRSGSKLVVALAPLPDSSSAAAANDLIATIDGVSLMPADREMQAHRPAKPPGIAGPKARKVVQPFL